MSQQPDPPSISPVIRAFFDEPTNTISYLVADPATGEAAIIDPVLDFDVASGKGGVKSARKILDYAGQYGWRIVIVLETHAHADHLSAAPYIKAMTGAPIGIGEHIKDVQKIFRPVFALNDMKTDGSDFDRLLRDGDKFSIGQLIVTVLHVPGHTPADVAYNIRANHIDSGEDSDVLFVGDTLFMPDYGTARTDFPGGDARTLYRSIRRVLSFPDDTRLFLCHDYKAPGRDDYRWETTVGEEKRNNIHVHEGVSEDEFVAMREARDATLVVPKLLLPSIQVNIRAGQLPVAEANGVSYLKIPIQIETDA
ncbi:MAG: MBL fold metallo-hydrolase [Sphingobium sp.]|nr:MBL fold metallo-hydrolase [Sphingobium sp.]